MKKINKAERKLTTGCLIISEYKYQKIFQYLEHHKA